MLMRSEQGDGRFDAAIDAAASALTAADPSPALRAAVRDRIGGRRTSWWLVPVGALAALIVVMLVGRALLGPSEGPGRVRAGTTRPGVAPEPIAVPGLAPDIQPVVAATTATRPPMRRLPTPFEPAPEDLEPLIPPIMIPPLETKQIAVDARSGVMPIEIEPLRIEPLQGE